jgi:PIN domain nuclease of toxin-antitoxin system
VILLDTHAWIWWVSAPDQLSPAARAAIAAASTVGVSPISCWEIATKASRGRLQLDRDVDAWVRQALAMERVEVAALTADAAVKAGTLGAEGFHGDPADRMIAATAMLRGVELVTKDAKIREFPGVRTIW